MHLSHFKKKNENFKTVNMEGVLFLINDTNDELGQHYDNKIFTNPDILYNTIYTRTKELNEKNIGYIFAVVPDKSVLMYNHISKNMSGKLQREHVKKILLLPSAVDGLKRINELAIKYKCHTCFVNDTHPNLLSQYGVYHSIMDCIGIEPIKYNISFVDNIVGDLEQTVNNGERKQVLTSWKYPVFDINPKLFNNYQIHVPSWKLVNISIIELFHNRHTYIDVYINNNADNDFSILIFHDSNVTVPDPRNGNYHPVKLLYSAHYKYTYFHWYKYDSSIVSRIKPNLVIEITAERFLNGYRC